MATTDNVESMSKVVIDPDGDLVLVLPNAEIQVSQKILSLTSTVFKAMLNGNFVEGNSNLVGGIRRVSLPGKCLMLRYSPLQRGTQAWLLWHLKCL